MPPSYLLQGRKKSQQITWTEEVEKAYEDIKKTLTTAPVVLNVTETMSRSIPETSVHILTTLKPDRWFRNKVKKQPDDYPFYRTENNILCKHIFPIHFLLSNTLLKNCYSKSKSIGDFVEESQRCWSF